MGSTTLYEGKFLVIQGISANLDEQIAFAERAFAEGITVSEEWLF